jgi:hypothetical protein
VIVRVDVPGAAVADQLDQPRVQRQVAVVLRVAQRDMLPVAGADLHHRVGVQVGQSTRNPDAEQFICRDVLRIELDSNQYGTTARERRLCRPRDCADLGPTMPAG